jgi:hypothetical protein
VLSEREANDASFQINFPHPAAATAATFVVLVATTAEREREIERENLATERSDVNVITDVIEFVVFFCFHVARVHAHKHTYTHIRTYIQCQFSFVVQQEQKSLKKILSCHG